MNSLKSLVLCLALTSVGQTVAAQSIDLPGLRHLRPFLEYETADDILPIDFSANTQVDEIYQLLIIEVAIQDNHYELAANEALNFLTHIKNTAYVAERATKLFLTLKNYEKALESVRYWIQVDDSEEVRGLFYLLLGENGQDEELSKYLRLALEMAPEADRQDVLLANAAILEGLENRQQAKTIFEQSSKGFLEDSTVLPLLKSDFALRANYIGEAWSEAYKALDNNADSLEAATRILYLAQGPRRKQAMNFVQNFLHGHPQARELYLAYIHELSKDGHYTQGIQEIKRMQKAAPEDFELLYFEALLQRDAQQYAQARQLLMQYIEIQKQRQQTTDNESTNAREQEVIARQLLASVYRAEKKYSLAIAQLEAISAEDTTLEIELEKAHLYARSGQITKALDKLSHISTESTEEKAMVYIVGGEILQTFGRTDQAIAYLDRALKEIPDNNSIKYNLAMYYEMRGQVDLTEKYLREVISAEPSDAHAYNALGYVFADKNYHLSEAQSLLERALVLEPDSPYILDSMGWLQFRLGNYSLALEYLELAYELEPQVDIAAHLADLYVEMDDKARAIAILKTALIEDKKSDKESEVLRETIKRLNLGIKVK